MINADTLKQLEAQHNPSDPQDPAPEAKKESNSLFIIKVGSTALNYSAQAVSTTGTTIIISKMLHGLAGAADLANLWQSVGRNAVGGGMVAIAQIFTKEVGIKPVLLPADLTPQEQLAREKTILCARENMAVGYALTAMLSMSSMTVFGLSFLALPYMADAETAAATHWYLLIAGAGGAWPTLASNTIGQTAYVRGYYKSPVICSFGNRIPSVVFSYLFVEYTRLNDIKGVAIGNLLGSWLSYLAMEIWMRHQDEFAFMEFKKLPFSKALLKKDLPPMIKLWAMMALQRFSEWGNLWVIGTLIGALASDNLKKTNASTTVIGILGLIYQGMGTAGNLTLAVDLKILESTETDIQTKKIISQKIKPLIFKFLMAGFVASVALGATVFFLKEYIVSMLSDDKSQGFSSISEKVLDITIIRLMGDSIRIISSNLLNARYKKNDSAENNNRRLGSGFYNILLPNIVSIVLMTIIGIPAGYLAGYLSGKKEDNDNMLICIFAASAVAVWLAAIINTMQLYHGINLDRKKLFPEEEDKSCAARFFALFDNKPTTRERRGSTGSNESAVSLITNQNNGYGAI
ncbi:MAG: hypothetical protein NTZ67_05570 [Gammaproteobacteria bacterium]|nr:hypothetical protein [Gammaproteobacteria bacterium]